jgi:hypothetical protein
VPLGTENFQVLTDFILNSGILDILETLQQHPVNKVYELSSNILYKFFMDEEHSEEMSSIKAAEAGEEEIEEFYENKE